MRKNTCLFRGFYPRGGGEVVVEANPIAFIKPVELTEFGQIRRIFGLSFVAGTLPIKVRFDFRKFRAFVNEYIRYDAIRLLVLHILIFIPVYFLVVLILYSG